MTIEFLIHAIVRQTTVLIAQIATAGGIRAPLAQVANQVFLDLVAELDAQGISRKVSADMFGMGLRSYLRRIQRLRESSTESGRSLWDAVLQYLRARDLVTKGQVLAHFHRDDEMQVRGVLHDLTASGEAQQNVGDTCYVEEECVFGTHCDHELGCPGTCVLDDPPLGEAGDPCDTVFDPEQRCVEPLVCRLPAGSAEQECGVAPRAGDPCTGPSECRCNGPEALCLSLGCDQSLGECVPLSEVGEPCSTLDATGVPDCLAPAWCDGGFDGGICRPPSAESEPCSIHTDCLGKLTCINQVCVPVVGPGATCTFGGDCLRGDCVDDV